MNETTAAATTTVRSYQGSFIKCARVSAYVNLLSLSGGEACFLKIEHDLLLASGIRGIHFSK